MIVASTSHLAECPDLGPECSSPTPPIPYNHHVDLFMNEVNLDVSYGIAPWLAVEGRVALRTVDVTPTYSERDGTPKLVPNDIHHHDETLIGVTDPWLVLRTGAALGKLITSARLGVTLPVGRTEPDPYKLGAEGKRHQHIQFGTGTFVPVVGIGASYAFESLELSLSALGLFSAYANDAGFRAPSRYFLNARATIPFRQGKVRPYVAFDMPHETLELWNGAPGLEGSNVRTEILFGGGLLWRFFPPWAAEVGFRARIASLTDAASFDYPGILEIGISTDIDIAGTSKKK
jgi:hypothetical protein